MPSKQALELVHLEKQYWLLRNGKKERQIEAVHIENIQTELMPWWSRINEITGILAFTFAIAVQGTPHPPLNAFLCLIFIHITHFAIVFNHFPPSIKALRKNKIDNEIARAVIRFVEPNLLGWRAIFSKAPSFLFGYLFLFAMILLALPSVQKLKIYPFESTLGQVFLPSSCACLIP